MSNDIKDGGPAFPGWTQDAAYEQGMTLRDYFAAKAMQGIWSNDHAIGSLGRDARADTVAEVAYKQADAMLKAREVPNA